MGDQTKNILIGVFVLAAFMIVTFMLLFLNPSVGDESKTYTVRFADIDKVNMGTRVTYGGKPVGEVTKIHLIEDPKNPRKSDNGYIYIYEITFKVDSSVDIYNSDDITLRTSGLLGERSIAITPMSPKPGSLLAPVGNTVLYATETGSVEETLKEFKELSNQFEKTLNAIQKTFQDINDEKIVAKLGETIESIGAFADSLSKEGKIESIVANIDRFTQDLARGEGTLGRFINSDDFYLRTNSLLSKAEIILDDINHYGPFFASDKNWQRVRARRANLLYSLCTPQEFKNFFNDELNEIFTSLERVNQVIQETETYDLCCPSYCDLDRENFKKVFAELMRRVKQMEESIRLYNTQLTAPEIYKTELCQ